MLDDTCYFLPCSTALEASILVALCNDPITLGLLGSISFRDAKRPITKKRLRRIDFHAVLESTDRRALLAEIKKVLVDKLGMPLHEPLNRAVDRMAVEFRGAKS